MWAAPYHGLTRGAAVDDVAGPAVRMDNTKLEARKYRHIADEMYRKGLM